MSDSSFDGLNNALNNARKYPLSKKYIYGRLSCSQGLWSVNKNYLGSIALIVTSLGGVKTEVKREHGIAKRRLHRKFLRIKCPPL